MKTLARQRDMSEILERLKKLRPDRVPRWGRMSVHQMVCHVADALRIVTGEMTVASNSNLLKRTMVKWVALYAPLPWPPGIPTSPEIDQVRGPGGTKPVDFAEDVARVEALLNAITSLAKGSDPEPHPMFGPMTDADWLRWGYLHMDHHLRQFGV